MKNKYVFMITTGSSRCNIHADFKVIDIEELIQIITSEKCNKCWWRDCIRYAKIGTTASLLKHMLLDEFESIFLEYNLTPKVITKCFRKEISEKYGLHKIRKTLKRIPKKDLEVGRCYLNAKGKDIWYFGKVKIEHFYPKKEYRGLNKFTEAYTETFEGILHDVYENKEYTNIEQILTYEYKNENNRKYFVYEKPLKNVRKMIEATNKRIEVPEVFKFTLTNGEKLKVEFLEVK